MSDEPPDSDAAPTVVRSEPPPSALADGRASHPPIESVPPAPRPVSAELAALNLPPPPRLVTPMGGTPRPALASVPPPARVLGAESSAPGPVANAASARPPGIAGAKALGRLSLERLRRAGGTLRQDVGSGFRQARAFVDAHDAWMPERLRQSVRPSALLGIAALSVSIIVVAVAVRLGRAGSDDSRRLSASLQPVSRSASVLAQATPARNPEPAAVKPTVVSREALAPAPAPERKEAVAAHEATAAADEDSLLLNSASSFASEKRDSEAVTLIERALLRNPALRSDPRVAKVLLRTAYSEDKTASAATFALLEGPMGERGAELMYELSLARLGKDSAHRHAQSWLRSKEFAKAAALPLYIVVKLRQAKTCEDKHALLGLASGGGKEVLDYLRELDAHTTCAPDDLVNCYPCLRQDNRLSDTIAALEKRTQT